MGCFLRCVEARVDVLGSAGLLLFLAGGEVLACLILALLRFLPGVMPVCPGAVSDLPFGLVVCAAAGSETPVAFTAGATCSSFSA
jgi:hypothetical protein